MNLKNEKNTIVIICGGRDFTNYSFLEESCYKVISDLLLKNQKITIRSGHALGADLLGERFAKENNFELEIYPADWTFLGKRAGFVRNEEMAKGKESNFPADICIAFWDGKSKGTKHMIDIMNKYNKLFYIFKY